MGSIVSKIFGGGGGGGSAPAPAPAGSGTTFQTSVIREAPGIEERKIELLDLARAAAQQPMTIPAMQVAGLDQLERQGLTAAGQVGVGAPTTTAGIGQLLAAQTPNISQFFNPYQQFVTDEIGRQAQIQQNQLAAQAVGAGAFGGGRLGVAQSELANRALQQIGLSQQQGFNTALGAAQQQQRTLGDIGLGLGNLGQQQQQMAQQDIQQLFDAGGVQRQLAQQTLDAARASRLQQAGAPFQRLDFLSNIYAAGPKTTSSIGSSTAPTQSPLAQAVGTGIGAFTAFDAMQQPRTT